MEEELNKWVGLMSVEMIKNNFNELVKIFGFVKVNDNIVSFVYELFIIVLIKFVFELRVLVLLVF